MPLLGKSSRSFGKNTNSQITDVYAKNTVLSISGDTPNNQGNTTTNFYDESSYNNKIIPTGDVAQTSSNPFGSEWSYLFNGTSTLQVPLSSAFKFDTEDYTIECWIYLTAAGGPEGTGLGSVYQYVVECLDGASSGPSIFFGNGGYNYKLGFAAASVGLGNYQRFINLSQGQAYGKWNHIALVKKDSVLRMYLNGVNQLTDGGASPSSFTVPSYTDIYNNTFANDPVIGRLLYGYISNLRIVKQALYTSDFTIPNAPLPAVPNTALLTCQSNRIEDNGPNKFRPAVTAGQVFVKKFGPTNRYFQNKNITENYSTYFNGSATLTAANSSVFGYGSADYTIECWFHLTANTGNYQNIVLSQDSNSYGPIIRFGNGGYNTCLQFSTYGPGTSNTRSANITQQQALNSWNHVAMVKRSNIVKLYYNGVPQRLDSGATPTSFTANSYTDAYNGIIPHAPTIGTSFNGYISNFRIVTGTAVYTQNFVPDNNPLTNIANTVLLTCQRAANVDISSSNLAITVTGSPVPNNFKPFFNTTSLSSTPVSYSSNLFGGSVYFDGAGDYLTVAEAPFQRLSNTFTIQGWFNATSQIAANIAIVSKGNVATGWEIGIGRANTLLFTNTTTALATTTPIKFNEWNHFAVTRQSSGDRTLVFLNGNLEVSGVITNPYTDNSNIYIGSGRVAGANVFTGFIAGIQIDNLSLYSNNFVVPYYSTRPTSANTIFSLANTPTIVDDADTTTVIASGDTNFRNFTPHAPEGQFSNYFNGTNDFLSVPTTLVQNEWWKTDFTIDAWVYPTNLSSWLSNEGPCLIGNMEVGSLTNYWSFGPNTNGTVRFKYFNGSPVNFDSTQTISTNQWSHIAFVKDSNGIRIYVNGVGTASTAVSGTPQTTSGLIIGRYNSSSILGYVSNLRVVKGTAVYTGNFTPPTAPLTALANTSLLTAQSRNFVDNSLNSFPLPRNGDVTVRNDNPFANVTAYTGQSIYFDGTGDLIKTTPNEYLNIIPAGANVTIEAWVYPQDLTRSLWTLGSEGPNRYTTFLTTNALAVNFFGAGSTLFDPIQANAWSHVAIVRQSNVVYAYINGIRQSNTETRTTALGNGLIRIGADGSGVSNFVGYMKDIRITRDVARYTANTTVPVKFTPAKPYLISSVNPMPPVEYLVVAGGGGGGGIYYAGGGGGGGVLTDYQFIPVYGSTYTVTVGAGGAAGSAASGTNGTNSVFGSITAIGGGGGATGGNGKNGGSGGGGSVGTGTIGGKGIYPGSSYLSQARQGYDGGAGAGSGDAYGATGGGGGAGGAGGNGINPWEAVADTTAGSNVFTVTAMASGTITVGSVINARYNLAANTSIVRQLTGTTGGVGTYLLSVAATGTNSGLGYPSTTSGSGGIGIASAISGTSTSYGGGGGGSNYTNTSGAGGAGGGGRGASNALNLTAGSGTVNTGGGGGAASHDTGFGFPSAGTAGAGGSGVVILRFLSVYADPRSTTGNPTITTSGIFKIYTFTSSGTITF